MNDITIEANTQGRDFYVGDIHGCFSLLEDMLELLDFDPAADRVFSVGDLVDKGPESGRAMDFLKQQWFHAVRGNKDESALNLARKIHATPNDPALISFIKKSSSMWLVEDETMQRLPDLIEAFEQLPYAIEVEPMQENGLPIGIVHAEIPLRMSWQKFKDVLGGQNKKASTQAKHSAVNGRRRIRKALGQKPKERHAQNQIQGLSALFVGHTPQKKRATILGNTHYIDTGACNGGCMTIVEVRYDDIGQLLFNQYSMARPNKRGSQVFREIRRFG